jgi:hypothetical protein
LCQKLTKISLQKLQLIVSKSQKPSATTTKASASQKSILSNAIKRKAQQTSESDEPSAKRPMAVVPSAMKCLAVLPGLGAYDSSDENSDDSSDFSEEFAAHGRIDLTGRKIKKKREDESE